jgi:hypothetical protein
MKLQRIITGQRQVRAESCTRAGSMQVANLALGMLLIIAEGLNYGLVRNPASLAMHFRSHEYRDQCFLVFKM